MKRGACGGRRTRILRQKRHGMPSQRAPPHSSSREEVDAEAETYADFLQQREKEHLLLVLFSHEKPWREHAEQTQECARVDSAVSLCGGPVLENVTQSYSGQNNTVDMNMPLGRRNAPFSLLHEKGTDILFQLLLDSAARTTATTQHPRLSQDRVQVLQNIP